MYFWMGVWQNLKCHRCDVPVLIVPCLKMMSCPVLFQMSRCVPDVFLCIQMLLYHISIVIYCVLYCCCVADVIIIKICVHLPSVKIRFRDKIVAKIMWPPLLALFDICVSLYVLCGHPMFNILC